MKKFLPLVIISFLWISESQAQVTRYIVKLKNKGATTFTIADPSGYLSARAVNRRTKYNIAIDSTDLPVPSSYVTQIRNIPNVTILNISKWLNAITIQTSDANAIVAINALPFVQSTSGIASRINNSVQNKYKEENPVPLIPNMARTEGIEGDFFNYGTTSFNEIHLHKGEFLHNIGLRGQGVQIAILDNGFNNYASSSYHAFDSVNANGQVLGTWDFVAREQNVTNDGNHGMQCFSTIAANIPGQFVGKAPKASFWLYQTEDNSAEYPIEEYNWACGAERADSSGADIISTSLGYTDFDAPLTGSTHTYADLNGNITMAAIAADFAAKKGMIVFASAGNDGNAPWHFLSTPSDGDSVIAVGAVNTGGAVAGFSSYGPSGDGQIKPDIASVGVSAIVQTPGGGIGTNNGTSFACPNMAGLSTCLWQGFPEFNNMRIIRALKEAGNIFNTPNDRIGYGIPDMKTAFSTLLTEYATSNTTINFCTVTLNWNSKDVSAMKYHVERKIQGDANYIKIGEVDAQAGNILANHSYQFDNMLINLPVPPGTISYRIRQIIDTSAASFAAIYIDTANITPQVTCVPPTTTGEVIFRVAPTPTTGNASLIVQTDDAISNMPITIHDMKGRLVMRLTKSKGAGRTTIDLPVSKLAAGKYIVTVYNNQKIIGSAELVRL